MLNLSIENVAGVAVIRCEGKLLQSDSAYQLRDAVVSQNARAIVLDLTDLQSMASNGVGMLIFLQRWTREHGIVFKLFNPSRQVRDKLERSGSVRDDLASVYDVVALADTDHSPMAMAS